MDAPLLDAREAELVVKEVQQRDRWLDVEPAGSVVDCQGNGMRHGAALLTNLGNRFL